MRRFTPLLLMLMLAGWANHRLMAFSLSGPDTSWMTIRLGYNVSPMLDPSSTAGAGFGGPMNVGEEYRLNMPVVTWGCSPNFLNYFGLRGLQEIEKAVAILNALPSADSININDYPLSAVRQNYKASTLGLFDLKSAALAVMLNHMGLADPTRFVFTLRERWIPPGNNPPTNYYVIMRNFDPDTWSYSPFINGQLWTYTTISDGDTTSFVVTQPVDPLALGGLLNAPVAGGWEGLAWQGFGDFWTGLTRDDVGGYKYIYRHNNYNLENAPTNSSRAGFGTTVIGGGSSSPWTIPNFGTNTTTGTGGTTLPGLSTNIVDLALRPGIGKVQWVHMIEESQIGSFVSNTVAWTDTFITNGILSSQNLLHTAGVPDVLFDAGDLNGADTGTPPGADPVSGFVVVTWNSTGNGNTTYGPGTIPPATGNAPALTFQFNTIGPTFFNQTQAFLSQITSGQTFRWGSFDGSSADPIIYPDRTSIEDLEAMVLGGGAGGTSGGISPGAQVGIWTPASQVFLPVGTVIGGGTGTGTGTGTGAGTGTGTGGTGG